MIDKNLEYFTINIEFIITKMTANWLRNWEIKFCIILTVLLSFIIEWHFGVFILIFAMGGFIGVWIVNHEHKEGKVVKSL